MIIIGTRYAYVYRLLTKQLNGNCSNRKQLRKEKQIKLHLQQPHDINNNMLLICDRAVSFLSEEQNTSQESETEKETGGKIKTMQLDDIFTC